MPPFPMGQDQRVSSYQQIKLLLRGRLHYAIILTVVLGSIGAVLGFFSEEPLYRSAAKVRINPVETGVIESDRVRPRFEEYLMLQVEVLRSPEVAKAAMRHPLWTAAHSHQAGGAETLTRDEFMQQIYLSRPRRLEVITIGFDAPDPEIAVAGAQSIVEAFKQVHERHELEQEGKRLDHLHSYINTLTNRLEQLDDKKYSFSVQYGLDTIEDRDRQLQNLIRDAQQALQQIELQIEIRTGGREGDLADGQGVLSIPELAEYDGEMQQMLRDKDLFERQLRLELAKGLGENHRRIIDLRAQIASLNDSLEQRARVIQGAAGNGPSTLNPIEQLRIQQRTYKKYIEELQTKQMQLGQIRRQVNEINIEIATVNNQLSQARAELERRKLNASIRGQIEDVSSASLPTSPANTTSRIQYAGLGGVCGGALGFGIVLVIGALDRRLRHADDAISGYGAVRMLGVLPSLPENMTDPEQSVLAAHAVHHVRTLLEIGVGDEDNGRVYSISGPAAGSGKTSLCFALGLSFANSDSKTLLIDADIVGGGLSHRLGVEVHRKIGHVLIEQGLINQAQFDSAARKAKATGSDIRDRLVNDGLVTEHQMRRAIRAQQQTSVGLLDACNGETLTDCVAQSDIRNLHILPIGSAMPHQAGALSPSTLRELIAEARRLFDIVLIDTGPVLGSLEASIAATESDGVVMIVSRGDPKRLAYKSLEHLMSINAVISGVVFNHALEDDVARTSYATFSVVQSRRQDARAAADRMDPAKTVRYGPLASAVASYGATKPANEDDGKKKAVSGIESRAGARQAS